MGYNVFLSHSSSDAQKVKNLCNYFEANNIGCWMAPRDIAIGENFAKAIVEAIRAADIFIVVFSSKANESDQVLREIDRAVHFKKKIISFRIDETKPTTALEYYLCNVTWMDASLGMIEQYYSRLYKICSEELIFLGKMKRTEEKKEPIHRQGRRYLRRKKRRNNYPMFFIMAFLLGIMYTTFRFRAVWKNYFIKDVYTTIKQENDIPPPMPKRRDISFKEIDFNSLAKTKIIDERLLESMSLKQLESIKKQIQNRGGIFFKRENGRIVKVLPTEIELSNIHLVEYQMNRIKISRMLDEKRKDAIHFSNIFLDTEIPGTWPMSERFLAWKLYTEVETFLLEKYGIKTMRSLKYIAENIDDKKRTSILKQFNSTFYLKVVYKNSRIPVFNIKYFGNVKSKAAALAIKESIKRGGFSKITTEEIPDSITILPGLVIEAGAGEITGKWNALEDTYPVFVGKYAKKIAEAVFKHLLAKSKRIKE
ncbi:MAG: toll/interleukin-1 receptor domain-containing protein [Bacteriovoracaceae bacterium]|nr:toll/interleukin-1 receptor domain-containing protein [Bacteriovoracaceae bacterium]